ncbi:uncharacterized protein G2W53_042534 [Senna tora]|uniref:Uncharacterized protein n=1 Tax=Senna tora TaxID=362788 RepID=A0A834SG51_9FABA|nr:uncharacterized protein G2W53_042534 [Senna tora]
MDVEPPWQLRPKGNLLDGSGPTFAASVGPAQPSPETMLIT